MLTFQRLPEWTNTDPLKTVSMLESRRLTLDMSGMTRRQSLPWHVRSMEGSGFDMFAVSVEDFITDPTK